VFLPMQVFERHGVTRDDLTAGRGGPGLLAALAELRAIARDHLRRARALRATVPPAIVPAFLPVALVEPYLRRMEGRGYDPFRTVVDLPQWKKQWLLWRAARRGGV
jgi:phytoene synthase